jgi:hypothetical protein
MSMIPWWPIALSFVGALIVAVGLAFTVQGWPRYVIVCGSVLTAIGGLWFTIYQVSYQTGGESFAYIEPAFVYPITPKDYIVTTYLMHKGQYPLYDLIVRVTDIEKLDEQVTQNPSGLLNPFQYQQSYTWPRLEAETAAMPFITWQLPQDRDEQSYNIGIASPRNFKRGVFQQLRCRRIDGEWRIALRVMRDDQVLIERGQQYLPRDEKGQAIWEKGIGRWAR